MRVFRPLLIAALVLLIGCSSGGEPAPTESDAASASEAEPTEASEVASAEPTEAEEEATEEPTEEDVASGGVESAAALFAPLPSGFKYAKLPQGAQQQLQSQLGGVEGSPIIGDFKARAINKKAKPVAVMFAVRFSDKATKADRRQFDVGVAQGVGAKGRPVTVGGKGVTLIKAQTPIYLYSGSDFSLLIFGTGQSDIEPVVAKVVQGVE